HLSKQIFLLDPNFSSHFLTHSPLLHQINVLSIQIHLKVRKCKNIQINFGDTYSHEITYVLLLINMIEPELVSYQLLLNYDNTKYLKVNTESRLHILCYILRNP